MNGTLYTVGHGTRTTLEFLDILAGFGIEVLADVRSYPRSRTNPQFDRETLAASLTGAGSQYQHWQALGGRRRGLGASSPNSAWEHPAFRGYADHMMSAEFSSALDQLLVQAAMARTVVMCSETLWWRCHRRMIADAALVRGATVRHIMKSGVTVDHALTPFARITDGRVAYGND